MGLPMLKRLFNWLFNRRPKGTPANPLPSNLERIELSQEDFEKIWNNFYDKYIRLQRYVPRIGKALLVGDDLYEDTKHLAKIVTIYDYLYKTIGGHTNDFMLSPDIKAIRGYLNNKD